MSCSCNTVTIQEIKKIDFKSLDGICMQIFFESYSQHGSYYSGRATFLIGSDEILGTHFWPNLSVDLLEHLIQSHPNQIIEKAFRSMDKYDYSTNIDEVKAWIKEKYADTISQMSKEWHKNFDDAFDNWNGMLVTKESLFFTDSTEVVLSELFGQDWVDMDILPKTKSKKYITVKRVLDEFQKSMRDGLIVKGSLSSRYL